MRKYCLSIYNKSYFLEHSEILIGINKDGILAFDDVITKYIQLTKIKEIYYLYSFVSDLQINGKNLDMEKSHPLKNNDVIKIKNFIMHFRELSSQRVEALKNFHYLAQLLQKKYDLCYVATDEEHYKTIFAINKITKQQVMIKALDPNTDDIIVTNEFRRECRLVKKMMFLQHLNLVKVIDVEQSMCPRYYITEYVETKSIQSFIEMHKKLHWLDALQIVEQIVNVLAYLHGTLQILHRNISPESVFITYHKEVKISNLQAMKSNQLINLTSRGAVKGSLLFTDPNVYSNKDDYCIQSDMYSLGLLFVYMATGSNPIGNVDDILKFDITSTNIKNHELKKFLIKLLHKDKDRRFKNYDELLEKVKEFYPEKKKNSPEEIVKNQKNEKNLDAGESRIPNRTQRIKITTRTGNLIQALSSDIEKVENEDNSDEKKQTQNIDITTKNEDNSDEKKQTQNIDITTKNEDNPGEKKQTQNIDTKQKSDVNEIAELLIICREIQENQKRMMTILSKLLEKHNSKT